MHGIVEQYAPAKEQGERCRALSESGSQNKSCDEQNDSNRPNGADAYLSRGNRSFASIFPVELFIECVVEVHPGRVNQSARDGELQKFSKGCSSPDDRAREAIGPNGGQIRNAPKD